MIKRLGWRSVLIFSLFLVFFALFLPSTRPPNQFQSLAAHESLGLRVVEIKRREPTEWELGIFMSNAGSRNVTISTIRVGVVTKQGTDDIWGNRNVRNVLPPGQSNLAIIRGNFGNEGESVDIEVQSPTGNLVLTSVRLGDMQERILAVIIPQGAAVLANNKNFEPQYVEYSLGLHTALRFRNSERWSVTVYVRLIDPKAESIEIPLSPGQEAYVTFRDEGRYQVWTVPWPWMRAEIVVHGRA